MVKFMARSYVEPLVEKRQTIVKNSLYTHELKHLKSRDAQNSIISTYVESRRCFWIKKAVPIELQGDFF